MIELHFYHPEKQLRHQIYMQQIINANFVLIMDLINFLLQDNDF